MGSFQIREESRIFTRRGEELNLRPQAIKLVLPDAGPARSENRCFQCLLVKGRAHSLILAEWRIEVSLLGRTLLGNDLKVDLAGPFAVWTRHSPRRGLVKIQPSKDKLVTAFGAFVYGLPTICSIRWRRMKTPLRRECKTSQDEIGQGGVAVDRSYLIVVSAAHFQTGQLRSFCGGGCQLRG